jgi:hypothetical protein
MMNMTIHSLKVDEIKIQQIFSQPTSENPRTSTMNDDNKLRDVRVGDYRLETWDANGQAHTGQCLIGYRFTSPTGEVIFEGEDFGCSPLHAIDSDQCLRGILGFLTCSPGDVDEEYFEKYTPEQMAFAEGDAESLFPWCDEEEPQPFEDFA